MKAEITRRYLAGLLDGEGYFGIIHSKYDTKDRHPKRYIGSFYRPAIIMASTHKEILVMVKFKMDCGYIYHRSIEKSNPNHKESWYWSVHTWKHVKEVLDFVYPYLIIKRKQAEILNEFLSTKQLVNNYHSLGHLGISPELQEQRSKLYKLMKVLNYRGIPPAETK